MIGNRYFKNHIDNNIYKVDVNNNIYLWAKTSIAPQWVHMVLALEPWPGYCLTEITKESTPAGTTHLMKGAGSCHSNSGIYDNRNRPLHFISMTESEAMLELL